MNKKLLKTVATMASASLVMLSTATCFADAIITSTKSEFDFNTGNVKVTTNAEGVGSGKMITYLLANKDTVSAGSDILFIDQKTTTGDAVEFSCTVDITKLEDAAAVMKMGSNAGLVFTTDAEELKDVAGNGEADVVTVFTKEDTDSITVVARVKNPDSLAKYGATFTAPGKAPIDIYALGADVDNGEESDATGKTGLSDGKYYAITVTGLAAAGVTDVARCTLVPFVK